MSVLGLSGPLEWGNRALSKMQLTFRYRGTFPQCTPELEALAVVFQQAVRLHSHGGPSLISHS